MRFLRRHSNGFQAVIHRHPTKKGSWAIYMVVDETIVELMAPTLAEAKGIADSLAVASHVSTEGCNDICRQWVTY
jgi:hypothetical protein